LDPVDIRSANLRRNLNVTSRSDISGEAFMENHGTRDKPHDSS
jgi:hypothetical protein